MLRLLPHLFADRGGTSAVEFAIIAPLMLTLCLGMFEGTEAVRANMKLRNATQTLAELVASQESVDRAQITDFCAAATLLIAPYATTTLSATIASVSNSGGTAAVDWQDTTCGSGTAISNVLTLAGPMVPNDGNSVIVVSSNYTYSGPITYVLPNTIRMGYTAYARPRTDVTVPHS